MDEAFKKQAWEWFERGRRDLETARLLQDKGGYSDSIAYHIQQAIEKYLKGYLVLHGKRPPKIHELNVLINLIADFDNDLSGFLDICEKASQYYLEDRYPPGPPAEYDYEEIKSDLKRASDLIKEIKKKVGILG